MAKIAAPPLVPRRPHRHEMHGDVRVDDYYWLRERENPEVVDYLKAENAWTDAAMAHTAQFQDALFEEIKGRIKQTDMSVPYRDGAYRYHVRFEDGREYEIHGRVRIDDAAAPAPAGIAAGPPPGEQLLLDVNRVAEGHEFCSVGALQVSPDDRLLAYAVDTVGRRQYAIRVRASRRATICPTSSRTSPPAWRGPRTAGPFSIPGTIRRPFARSRCCATGWETTRPTTGWCSRRPTKRSFAASGAAGRAGTLLIGSFQTITTEYRLIDASDPDADPVVFPAARAGARIRRRSLPRAVLHPDERRRRQLPPDGGGGGARGARRLEGADPAPRRRVLRGIRAVPRPPGARRAARWPDAALRSHRGAARRRTRSRSARRRTRFPSPRTAIRRRRPSGSTTARWPPRRRSTTTTW